MDRVYGQNWVGQYLDRRYSSVTESIIRRRTSEWIVWNSVWSGLRHGTWEVRHRAMHIMGKDIFYLVR